MEFIGVKCIVLIRNTKTAKIFYYLELTRTPVVFDISLSVSNKLAVADYLLFEQKRKFL